MQDFARGGIMQDFLPWGGLIEGASVGFFAGRRVIRLKPPLFTRITFYFGVEFGLTLTVCNVVSGLPSFAHLIRIQSGFYPHLEVDYLTL